MAYHPDAHAPTHTPSQVFHVRCGEVELKVTVPAKGLANSLRDGVVIPFMKVRRRGRRVPGVPSSLGCYAWGALRHA